MGKLQGPGQRRRDSTAVLSGIGGTEPVLLGPRLGGGGGWGAAQRYRAFKCFSV